MELKGQPNEIKDYLELGTDHYPKFILTLDDDPEADYNGIRRINALDWLLGVG